MREDEGDEPQDAMRTSNEQRQDDDMIQDDDDQDSEEGDGKGVLDELLEGQISRTARAWPARAPWAGFGFASTLFVPDADVHSSSSVLYRVLASLLCGRSKRR
jgi:hypothetical protein